MTNQPADSHESQSRNGHDGPTDADTVQGDAAGVGQPGIDELAADGPEPDSTTVEDRSAVDPANRWATEHYGFEDESPPVATSTPAGSVVRGGVAGLWSRRRALLAAGALGLVVTGGVGGAAIAASANGEGDGGFDGRRDNDQVSADIDGDGRRGRFR